MLGLLTQYNDALSAGSRVQSWCGSGCHQKDSKDRLFELFFFVPATEGTGGWLKLLDCTHCISVLVGRAEAAGRPGSLCCCGVTCLEALSSLPDLNRKQSVPEFVVRLNQNMLVLFHSVTVNHFQARYMQVGTLLWLQNQMNSSTWKFKEKLYLFGFVCRLDKGSRRSSSSVNVSPFTVAALHSQLAYTCNQGQNKTWLGGPLGSNLHLAGPPPPNGGVSVPGVDLLQAGLENLQPLRHLLPGHRPARRQTGTVRRLRLEGGDGEVAEPGVLLLARHQLVPQQLGEVPHILAGSGLKHSSALQAKQELCRW